MSSSAGAADPKVSARAALLMDAKTGEVLWSKRPDDRRAPASTTKIVTTMLALESGRLDDALTVSKRAQSQVPSKLYLEKGQRMSLRDLTYSLMLKSANDGAVVVAEGLDGSVEAFAKRMESRARKAGATKTNFRNPSGLPNSKHLSTARDLAKIVRAALDVPGFRKVAGTTSRKIRIRGTKTRTTTIKNKNRLVQGYFASVIGKTGYTRAAGRCFAGAAQYEGREVIVVVLGAKDLWGDTRKLLEWAHRGDGASAWPRVQLARATTGSSAKAGRKTATTGSSAMAGTKTATTGSSAKAGTKTATTESSAKTGTKTATTGSSAKTGTKTATTGSATTKRAGTKTADTPAPRKVVVAKAAPSAAPPAPVRSAALDEATLRRVRAAALEDARALRAPSKTRQDSTSPRVRSAALTTPTPRSRPSAFSAGAPAKVASVRSTEVPAYVLSYRPEGRVRRGCTGTGCSSGARYWPAR